jgi:D-beta-D-heptose 7-phosphate kinase/D-beta-D-heptose 1-phosphate adenosyltransferase
MKNSRILVIGESCTDVFYSGDVDRLCPEAPVPVFKVRSKTDNGGMAKNVQNNLVSLGNQVDIITNENWTLIQKCRYVHYDINHMFIRVDYGDDAYGQLSIEKLDEYDFNSYDAVVVSDYNKGFLSEQILKEISNRHQLLFLDTKKILGDWCKNYSFIKINSKEYNNTQHTIDDEIKKNLIVTRGQHGCVYNNKVYHVPKVEIKDTSGAGDTFISGLCSEYCKNKDIEKAINFANECATKVVQKRGVTTA